MGAASPARAAGSALQNVMAKVSTNPSLKEWQKNRLRDSIELAQNPSKKRPGDKRTNKELLDACYNEFVDIALRTLDYKYEDLLSEKHDAQNSQLYVRARQALANTRYSIYGDRGKWATLDGMLTRMGELKTPADLAKELTTVEGELEKPFQPLPECKVALDKTAVKELLDRWTAETPSIKSEAEKMKAALAKMPEELDLGAPLFDPYENIVALMVTAQGKTLAEALLKRVSSGNVVMRDATPADLAILRGLGNDTLGLAAWSWRGQGKEDGQATLMYRGLLPWLVSAPVYFHEGTHLTHPELLRDGRNLDARFALGGTLQWLAKKLAGIWSERAMTVGKRVKQDAKAWEIFFQFQWEKHAFDQAAQQAKQLGDLKACVRELAARYKDGGLYFAENIISEEDLALTYGLIPEVVKDIGKIKAVLEKAAPSAGKIQGVHK